MKFNYESRPEGRKTARIRGVIIALVRAEAARRKTITAPDLVPPLADHQAFNMLRKLVKNGELKVVKAGQRGRAGAHTIYSAV